MEDLARVEGQFHEKETILKHVADLDTALGEAQARNSYMRLSLKVSDRHYQLLEKKSHAV